MLYHHKIRTLKIAVIKFVELITVPLIICTNFAKYANIKYAQCRNTLKYAQKCRNMSKICSKVSKYAKYTQCLKCKINTNVRTMSKIKSSIEVGSGHYESAEKIAYYVGPYLWIPWKWFFKIKETNQWAAHQQVTGGVQRAN